MCSSNLFKGVVRETFHFRYGIQALILSKSKDSIASSLLFEWAKTINLVKNFVYTLQQELYHLQYCNLFMFQPENRMKLDGFVRNLHAIDGHALDNEMLTSI